jgi:UDP-glucose 4-epimerase
VPAVAAMWAERGWRFPSRLDRVYVNDRARTELGWRPRFDLNSIAEMVAADGTVHTPLARQVGSKDYVASSYHRGTFRP